MDTARSPSYAIINRSSQVKYENEIWLKITTYKKKVAKQHFLIKAGSHNWMRQRRIDIVPRHRLTVIILVTLN